MMIHTYVQSATDHVTTHESHRNGFLEYALRKSKESIPYIDKAKALKLILEQKTKNSRDILKLEEIKGSCYEAAGVSSLLSRLIFLAIERGTDDNISAVSVRIHGLKPAPAGEKQGDWRWLRSLVPAS